MDVKAFEGFVFEKMTESRFPGMSVAVVKGDEVIYSRGFGVADVEKQVAATPETLYPAASITKSFAAIAILQLAEKGKLSVDDEAGKYVEFPVEVKGGPVRVKHLLSHTSGLAALGYIEALIGTVQGLGNAPVPVTGPKDVPMFMRGAEGWVAGVPGERWFYNNEGYVLLGEIVEKVTGMGWEAYVRENILKPLGMARSVFGEEGVKGAGQMSVPYVVEGETVRAGKQIYSAWGADAALFTNVMDLAKYVSMFLRKGKGVMSEGTFSEMTKGRVATPGQPANELFGEKAGTATQYGYGLSMRDFLGEPVVGHTGSVTVSTGYFGFLARSGVGVAVLGNSGAYPVLSVGQVALACATGRDPYALGFLRVEKVLKELSGLYESYRKIMRREVRRQGNFLLSKNTSRKSGETDVLVPVRLDGFERGEVKFMTYAEGSRTEVEFRRREGVWEMLMERYLFKRVGPVGK